MPDQELENHIRTLCANVIAAEEPELSSLIHELREAIRLQNEQARKGLVRDLMRSFREPAGAN
jgi:hypothetical protein